VTYTFRATPTGPDLAVKDAGGTTPLASIVSARNGLIPVFSIDDVTRGFLVTSGFPPQEVLSSAAKDGATAAASAASSATAAANSAASAATAAAVAAAAPGALTLVQNGDGTWPDRRTVTTDRTKLVFCIVLDSTQLPATAPVATTGAGLALPTNLDQFLATP